MMQSLQKYGHQEVLSTSMWIIFFPKELTRIYNVFGLTIQVTKDVEEYNLIPQKIFP